MTSKNGLPIRLWGRLSDHENSGKLNISPLHTAAFQGDTDTVKKLIANKIDINATDYYEWTALHDAAIQGHSEIVQLLIDAGANLNAQDNEERYTPLHDAARMGHTNIMQSLINAGADTSIQDAQGNTAFAILQKTSKL